MLFSTSTKSKNTLLKQKVLVDQFDSKVTFW
jgi:hypothetical protein